MKIRGSEYPGNPKRGHQVALCGELALEEGTDLSQDKVITELLRTFESKNIAAE